MALENRKGRPRRDGPDRVAAVDKIKVTSRVTCPLACSPSCSFRCPITITDAINEFVMAVAS